MPETSYMGVGFTPEQQAVLDKNLILINTLTQDIVGLQNRYSDLESQVQNAMAQVSSCPSPTAFKPHQGDDCRSEWNGKWDWARGEQANVNSTIGTKRAMIVTAQTNYNNDLAALENAIKLQIQAQQANTQATTQTAANQVAIQQNDPRILLQKAEAEAASKLKALELQGTLDKQKRDEQVKIMGFLVIGVLVLGIGWYVIKKLL